MKAGEWRRKGNFSSSSREGTVGTLFRFSVGDGTRWALSIGRAGYPFQVLGAQKCMPWLELASVGIHWSRAAGHGRFITMSCNPTQAQISLLCSAPPPVLLFVSDGEGGCYVRLQI